MRVFENRDSILSIYGHYPILILWVSWWTFSCLFSSHIFSFAYKGGGMSKPLFRHDVIKILSSPQVFNQTEKNVKCHNFPTPKRQPFVKKNIWCAFTHVSYETCHAFPPTAEKAPFGDACGVGHWPIKNCFVSRMLASMQAPLHGCKTSFGGIGGLPPMDWVWMNTYWKRFEWTPVAAEKLSWLPV